MFERYVTRASQPASMASQHGQDGEKRRVPVYLAIHAQ